MSSFCNKQNGFMMRFLFVIFASGSIGYGNDMLTPSGDAVPLRKLFNMHSTYKGGYLGVSTTVKMAPPNIAHVSINGIGIDQTGTASLSRAHDFKFDSTFSDFLKLRRVCISRIVIANEEKISILVIVPLLGRLTINLFREHDLIDEL